MKCSFEAYEGKEKYIFVSYAHKDSKIIMPIIEALHDNGYRIWYDDGIHPGDEWRETIASRLIGSSLVLGFFSQNSLESQNCKNEINFAMSRKIDLICIHLEQVQMSIGLEMELSSYQALFYFAFASTSDFLKKLEKSDKLNSGLMEKVVVSTKQQFDLYEQEIDNEYYIFPSYAHSDRGIVKPIINDLRTKGYNINCNIDISHGYTYIDDTTARLIYSTLILSFISEKSLKSEYFKRELNFVISNNINVIYIYLEPMQMSTELEMILSSYQNISYYSYSSVSEFLDKLEDTKLMIDALSPQNHIKLYEKENGKIFDFYVDKQNHVRISKYYDSPERTNIHIPKFVYGFKKHIAVRTFTNSDHLEKIHIYPTLKDLSYMFYNANIKTLDLSDWDVSNITDMNNMFTYSNLTSIGNLDNWNVSNVSDMANMFDNTQLTPPKWYK